MAKMIPSEFDGATASAAERRFFELLKHDPETADWTVLHSLGLARRGKKPFGEIDFVVAIPGAGVVCLEVKGGGVSCHGGVWQTVNRFGDVEALKRSPFAQAREGMFALRDTVLNRAPVGFPSGIVFGYAVVMPDVLFTAKSSEWEAHQIIDQDTLRRPVSAAVKRLALEQRKLLNIDSTEKEPARATIGILIQLLRPDFEAVVTRGTQVEQTEERLLQLTQEQFDALDLLADNSRCLFDGAAGTGKTMLALEYARRSARSGLHTLLVCFNRLLGDWLEKQIAGSSFRAELTAGRHFKLLRETILRSSLATEFAEKERNEHGWELYDRIYGDFGSLAIEEVGDTYDVLVVDEAQDLLRPGVLDSFGAWLIGGLAGGRWAIFADFQRQAIFGSRSADQIKALLLERAPHFANGRLRQNCRNTRSIGEETALLSGFDSLPYRVGQITGLAVDYRYYDSSASQRAVLAQVLRRLLADGVKATDIVVLSRNRLANSGVAGVDGGTDFKLADVADLERSRVPVVRFATVQAFKGMESPVIVLCDVSHVSENEPQALLYVAMSRARSQLTILVDEQARPLIRECLRRRLEMLKNL
jgi:hypothetical protein